MPREFPNLAYESYFSKFLIFNILGLWFVCFTSRVPAWRQLKQSSFSEGSCEESYSHTQYRLRVFRFFVLYQPTHLHHVVLGNKSILCWASHDRPMLSSVHLPTLGKAICSTFGQLYSLKMAKHPHNTVVRMKIEIVNAHHSGSLWPGDIILKKGESADIGLNGRRPGQGLQEKFELYFTQSWTLWIVHHYWL